MNCLQTVLQTGQEKFGCTRAGNAEPRTLLVVALMLSLPFFKTHFE